MVSTCDFESQDPGSNPGISSTRVVQGYLVFTQKAGVRLPAWVFFFVGNTPFFLLLHVKGGAHEQCPVRKHIDIQPKISEEARLSLFKRREIGCFAPMWIHDLRGFTIWIRDLRGFAVCMDS